jgi:hypothetical protein
MGPKNAILIWLMVQMHSCFELATTKPSDQCHGGAALPGLQYHHLGLPGQRQQVYKSPMAMGTLAKE